jgi:hypothetical protein
MQQALWLNCLHTVSDISCRREKVQSGLLHALKRNSFWNGDLITPTVEREEPSCTIIPNSKLRHCRCAKQREAVLPIHASNPRG